MKTGEFVITLKGMFYGPKDRKLYRKIKSAMPFLSYKQITFLSVRATLS